MEFKEFENPEQAGYDVKAGVKNAKTLTPIVDNSLNTEAGIDLNALADADLDEFSLEQLQTVKSEVSKGNFTINEFGEIIRPEGKSPSK